MVDYSRNYYLNLPEHKRNEIKEKINEKMKAKYHNMSDEEMQKQRVSKNISKKVPCKKETRTRK